MREIKFRGKRLDNSEWLYGSLINNAFTVSATGAQCTYIFDNSIIEYDCFTEIGEIVDDIGEVDPATVGQFTGLKDIKGVEIYEGDKLDDPDDDGIDYRVEFNKANASFDVVSYGIRGSLMEHGFDEDAGEYGELDRYNFEDENHHYVIGTIHDDQELMEK